MPELDYHEYIGDDAAAKIWLHSVIREHGFLPEVQNHILDSSWVHIVDWQSTSGGGHLHPSWLHHPNYIWLLTAEVMAAVHESAHVAWHYILEKLLSSAQATSIKNVLVNGMLYEADQPLTSWTTVRTLCHDYKYGTENWDGMCPNGYSNCNDKEVFAGLASGTLGDMRLMPPRLRPPFAYAFRMPKKIFLPGVF